jgi:hypothetical protein
MIKKRLWGSFVCICIVVSVLNFSSCSRSDEVQSVAEVKLFTLPYGNFDNQLNMFDLSNVGNINTVMTMRNGFFYIANGESKKIMELNSYGDLLTLLYSDDSNGNTVPADVKSTSIKKPFNFPVDFSGSIAVDSKKRIYITGTLPEERQERDEDENLLESQIVLRFADNGNSVDYLGQQGVGGTPFPFIRNIYTTANDELVVVCTTNSGSVVYWFSQSGFLMYKIPVESKTIPPLSNAASYSELFVTVENVIPDYTSRRLYVKIDYYASSIDKDSKVQSGIDYLKTLLYPLNVETGVYEGPLAIPPYEEEVTADFSKLVYRLPYDYLGETKNGWQFFVVSTKTGFNVEMVQPASQKILRRHFDVSHNDALYYSFSLSDTGIISALFVEKEKAEVIWWRTDSLTTALLKS